MKTGGEIDERARLSMERHGESVSRNNKYIELNPTLISNNYTNLYSNYITNIPNTDHTLLTI